MKRILIVEDDPDGRRSVSEVVEGMGCDVTAVENGADAVASFEGSAFDVVLSDLVLPDFDGIEVLRKVKEIDDGTPVVIMTAYGSVETAVEAMKAGAYDYVTKPLDMTDLETKLSRALEASGLRKEIRSLSESIRSKYSIRSIVAESSCMKEMVNEVERVSETDATVLISGESGTGKEVVARALHVDGKRSKGPFVAVNCGAFTESLLESALFGHEKGSFTGASERRLGAFESADKGTLFLDEVGNAPQSVQVKLLRVLEEREFTRVGGQDMIAVDVRVISASNKDLEELVQASDFREDLLYRLKVITLEMPPLRDRRLDVRPLVDRFVAEACAEHGREISGIDSDCYAFLEQQEWPGNVRQLRNVIQASVVLAQSTQLSADDIRLDVPSKREEADMIVPDDVSMADLEREILSQLLVRHHGNRSLVADKLGVSRRTIQRKIKDLALPF